jgi:hypothetical protein
MPLDRYGVLSGQLVSHHRDQPDNQGRWYHINLMVSAPQGEYRCAIDVDSHASNTGVEWRVIPIETRAIAVILALSAGYHDLALNSSSGAIDYIRSPWLRAKVGCLFVTMPNALLQFILAILGAIVNQWQRGNSLQASTALEGILHPGKRILVWGEPFTSGLGMHNVHQNQGDPAGSQWWAENAIWQDGGTIAEQPDGSWVAFISKFTSQAYRTDNSGHPST